MTGYEFAALVISAFQATASIGAVIAILWGIRQMSRAGDQRAVREDARHTESMTALKALVQQQDANHAESMTALRALVQGLEQQGEALREQGAALREQGAALRAQGAALEATLKGRI